MENNEVLISVSLEIILNAGNARVEMEKALEKAENFDFVGIDEYVKNAEDFIKKAHLAQTKVIQDEASGIKYGNCLLFTHAQDTLMTIMSEMKLSKHLINLAKQVDKRLTNNEN